MKTGFQGTFVIAWSQTELDGLKAARIEDLCVGSVWQWAGEAMRVDGPNNVVRLAPTSAQQDLRRRAGLSVRRLVTGKRSKAAEPIALHRPLFDNTFTVTDGLETWDITLIPSASGRKPLVMFVGAIPPREAELWVVQQNVSQRFRRAVSDDPGGVICFTPGTMIATPYGLRDIASLREGDYIQTRDNGPAEIVWMGQRRVSGARMIAMPHLAPIRLRRGALDNDVPDAGLLVSPDHRVLLRGPRARALFGSDEVLVNARDLVNDHSIIVDRAIRQVTYLHMMLPRHEIVFANGVATETFHPASADLAMMEPDEQARLAEHLPDVAIDSSAYGGYARRVLAASEAAILQSDLAYRPRSSSR